MNIPQTAAERTASVRKAQATRWGDDVKVAKFHAELIQAQVDVLRGELARKEAELAAAQRAYAPYEQKGEAR